jgi:hypothetical protein
MSDADGPEKPVLGRRYGRIIGFKDGKSKEAGRKIPDSLRQ